MVTADINFNQVMITDNAVTTGYITIGPSVTSSDVQVGDQIFVANKAQGVREVYDTQARLLRTEPL